MVVDFKYDVLCVGYTSLSPLKERLEICISGSNWMLQRYIETATPLSD